MLTGMKDLLCVLPLLLAIRLGAQVLPEFPQEYLEVCYPNNATTITVCASGCDYPNSQLQQAFNAAQPGTTILLQSGHTYSGAFTLPTKTGNA